MSDLETAARGQRATLCDEFIRPILDETKRGYLDRMAEIAATELSPRVRAEKITALAIALKVLGNLDNGLSAAIHAGELASRNLMRASEIEQMGRERRKLFDIVPSR